MTITANGKEYILDTSLQTLERIQDRLSKPAAQIFTSINEMTTAKQISLLCIAAGKEGGQTLREDILSDSDNWGMFKITESLEELVAKMLFSGTTEEKERQISKAFGDDEQQKNAVRAMLGLPQKPIGTNGGNDW